MIFLTADGAPLVAELKRGEAPDTVDMQALKNAAYCSQPAQPADKARVESYLLAACSWEEQGAWSEAWEQGRAMTLEEAISYALEGRNRQGADPFFRVCWRRRRRAPDTTVDTTQSAIRSNGEQPSAR